MTFLFMLFQDSASGNFFGTVSIPTTLFGRLFNVLILALLFLTAMWYTVEIVASFQVIQ